MDLSLFRQLRPGTQLLIAGILIIASFLTLQVIAVLLAIPFFGVEQVTTILTGLDFSDPSAIAILKYMQVFQSVGLFIVPAFLAARLFSSRSSHYLYLHIKPTFVLVALVFVLIIAVHPFINYSGAINARMHFPEWMAGIETWMRNAEDAAEKLIETFLKVETVGGLLFNLFMVAVLPALGEELLFRGVIQKLFIKITRNYHWGIWITAILFSALHLQFYGFIPRMLLGAIFGYMLVWTGSLWVPVIAHFINNALAVTALFLIDHGHLSATIEEWGTGMNDWPIALVSLAVGLVILVAIKKQPVAILQKDEPPHPDYSGPHK